MATATTQVDPRVREVLDRFSELQAKRASFDDRWRWINQLIAPSRTYTMDANPQELRRRILRDPIGVMSNKRLAAFIYGDMLSPAEPWVQPYLLNRDPTEEEAQWFEHVQIKMHDHMSGPGSPIATQLAEAAQDATAAGNNVTFKIRRAGQLPRVQTIPLAQAYWDEDGEGVTDTVYRKFTHSARVAARRYPKCEPIQKAAEKDPAKELCFVHAVEPREGGGLEYARKERKPFTSDVVSVDFSKFVSQEGYDRLPFQIGRFERQSGEIYGTGPGWDAVPAVYTSNSMTESMIRAAEMAVDPPLFGDRNLFGGRLDRRPGAFNPVNQQMLLGQDIRALVGKFDFAGDAGLGVQILEIQRAQVERIFYIDWLWLREGPQMTATEVNARRDLRMRMLAPIVARLEQEWLNPLVDDIFLALLEAGFFLPPPRTLAGEEIGFRYASPLALAQRGAHVEAIDRTFAIATRAAAIDESAPQVLRADEMLREAATKLGVKERFTRPQDELEAMRAERARQQQEATAAAAAKDAAGALQAGAQGIASLAGVDRQAA